MFFSGNTKLFISGHAPPPLPTSLKNPFKVLVLSKHRTSTYNIITSNECIAGNWIELDENIYQCEREWFTTYAYRKEAIKVST